MNTYKVYFKDGTSKEVKAICESDVKFKVSLYRSEQDIIRIEFIWK